MNENISDKQWFWMMDWCKQNKVSPFNTYFWNKAKEEYQNAQIEKGE